MKDTLKLMKLMIKLTKSISGDRIGQIVLFGDPDGPVYDVTDEVQPLAFEILHEMAGSDSSRHKLLAEELPWAFKFAEHPPKN